MRLSFARLLHRRRRAIGEATIAAGIAQPGHQDSLNGCGPSKPASKRLRNSSTAESDVNFLTGGRARNILYGEFADR
jgi:hypothetical protein